MLSLLGVVIVYTFVFGVDYLRYRSNPLTYQYVSRRTYLLFLVGILPIIYLFYTDFESFFEHIYTEIALISLLLAMMLLFSYLLSRERLLVCHTSSRTERCLTAGYVLTKGKEIMFQQFCYAGVAFSLVTLLGSGFWTYVGYIVILLIMHTPVILSMNVSAASRLTLGILVMAAPLFYIFIEVQHFWPSMYLHALLYVFLWLTFADWEGKIIHVSHETNKVDKWG